MLNVTESHNVNRIIDWTMGRPAPGHGSRHVTDQEAFEALQQLAGAAHKRLGAGWRPDQLEPLFWKRLRELRQPRLL